MAGVMVGEGLQKTFGRTASHLAQQGHSVLGRLEEARTQYLLSARKEKRSRVPACAFLATATIMLFSATYFGIGVEVWLDGQSLGFVSSKEDMEKIIDKVEERTLSGSGREYVNAQGISLFNRTEKTVDLAAIAQAGSSLHFQPAEAGPQILILHTHSTEAYAQDSAAPYQESGTARTTDPSYNIIKVGEEITRIFEEMGLSVIHDTNLYDYPDYNGAYERSKAAAAQYLAQYPTLQMVLDVHRDALVGADGTVYKPVLQIDGVKTAQVMLLVGSDDAGAVFPDWTEHMALAMELQQQMNSLWPGLARPITLRTARFNQQMTKGSLLVEVGSHGNTLDEALAGARLFARSAAKVLLTRVG